jgi:Skp family chaperone for outer membrane proteins
MAAPLLAAVMWAGAVQAGAAAERPFRMCVLDQGALLQHSERAKREAARFQQIRQKAQANFDASRRDLDTEARTFESLQASLPELVREAKAQDLARRREDLKARGDQVNKYLAELDTELTNSVSRAAAPAVRAAETERGCSVLVARGALLNLDDLSLDITASVVARFDATKGGN